MALSNAATPNSECLTANIAHPGSIAVASRPLLARHQTYDGGVETQ